VGKFLVVVTKRDQFLGSCITDSKDVKTVIIVPRPLRNLRRIPAKGANEVLYHSSQLVVLPGNKYKCFVVLGFRKLMLQANNILIPKVRANRQAQPDCCRFNRGKWPDVSKLAYTPSVTFPSGSGAKT
jgi:hypothetical protein